MRFLTDIAPTSVGCPDSAGTWDEWSPRPETEQLVHACFNGTGVLYTARANEAELSDNFPLVIWREKANGSQIDLVRRLIEEEAWMPDRVVFVAQDGQGFRGHYDRRWESALGNLQVTIFLRDGLPCKHAGLGYAVLPILALTDATQDILGPDRAARIKWINDIIVGGSKVGGALGHILSRGEMFENGIFGMGLNTSVIPEIPENPFVPRIGSLGLPSTGPTRVEVLARLLTDFLANLYLLETEGGEALVSRYKALCEVVGKKARIYEDGPGMDDRLIEERRLLARGEVTGLDDHLRVLIEGKPYGMGRLAYEEDCPPLNGSHPSD